MSGEMSLEALIKALGYKGKFHPLLEGDVPPIGGGTAACR